MHALAEHTHLGTNMTSEGGYIIKAIAGRIATNRQGAAINGGTTLTRMGIGHLGPIYYYFRKRSPYIYYEMADGSCYCVAGPVSVLHIHSERA